MKQFFTYPFYIKKSFRFILLLLIILVGFPVIETPQAEAQTNNTGNFLTKRFKRTHKFKRKSKNSTAFQRKPFSCEDIGKTKVEQLKTSKKQILRWEEERLVKAEQDKIKEQRQANTQNKSTDTEEIVILASSETDMDEMSKQKKKTVTTLKKDIPTNKENKIVIKAEKKVVEKEVENVEVVENSEPAGWYTSEKPDAPKISPILINQKDEIASQKNKQDLEIVAKHSRLGYKIVLESNNEKQLQTVKNYLISIGTEEETIQINSSTTSQNEVNIKIEK